MKHRGQMALPNTEKKRDIWNKKAYCICQKQSELEAELVSYSSGYISIFKVTVGPLCC